MFFSSFESFFPCGVSNREAEQIPLRFFASYTKALLSSSGGYFSSESIGVADQALHVTSHLHRLLEAEELSWTSS